MKTKSLLLLLLLISQNAFGQTTVADISVNAYKLMRENKVGEALEEIGKAIGMEPNKAGPYIVRANIHKFAKDYANVRKDAERAIQLEPDSESTLIAVSRVLETGFREDCERKSSFASSFISKIPSNAAAYAERSAVKACLEDIVGAFNDISQAVDLDPDVAVYKNNRANLISKLGDSEKAIDLYKMLIDDLRKKIIKEKGSFYDGRAASELTMAFLSRARVHERIGNIDLSIADLTSAVELKFSEIALTQRAAAYTKAGRFGDAIADLTKLIAFRQKEAKESGAEDNNANIIIASLKGERSGLYVRSGKYSEALSDLQECLLLDPLRKDRIEKRIAEVKIKQADALKR